ncbi:MAG: hypothetical protein HY537_11895 [Deltaproteobacteria bacterium]|nr:hypothetical protein [Deltaproteobacteria bacterium]
MGIITVIGTLGIIVCNLSFAFVSDSFRVEGIVKSFNKEEVKLKTESTTLSVPRSSVVSRFELKAGCPVTAEVLPEEIKVEGKASKSSGLTSPFAKTHLANPAPVELQEMPK